MYSGHARGRQDGGSEAGQERGREQDRRRQDGMYAGQEGDKTVGARQDWREGRSRTGGGRTGEREGAGQDRRDAEEEGLRTEGMLTFTAMRKNVVVVMKLYNLIIASVTIYYNFLIS